MTARTQKMSKDAQQAHDYLLQLGKLTVDFAHVERVPHYDINHPENDVEHSFHLAISAMELAANYHPELDVGLVAQFSLVHDLPEVYVGDVPTFDITDEKRAEKESAERVATERLVKELPPHLGQLLKRYEDQIEPEARFVRLIDKLLPAVINMINPELSRVLFKRNYDVTTKEELDAGEPAKVARLVAMFPEYDFVHIIREIVVTSLGERVFENETK
ncbi:MAG: Metal dependent phosphohydrolase [Candidatus Saccharibacteria bacterium]|nr:Metal dependent phosphohydrolase [Candidatus Saccharibacteria bacterium]